MRGRRIHAFGVVLALLVSFPGASGGAEEPADVEPGCDPDRPAVAHSAGGVVLDPQPPDGPIACGMYTGFPGGETRIEVTNTGTIIYAPAGHQPEPQTTMHGRGGVAISHDQGATWTLSLPLGMTWHQNDQETHVDPETGRFFWAVMFKNGPGQVPSRPGETPWDDVDDDELPGSHLYALPRGEPDLDPRALAAITATPATSHIVTTADEGETWTYGTTCCEIVNGAIVLTAPAPAGTEEPTDYPNVVYYCWRASQTFHSRPPEGICSRSLDGGSTWEIRGWNHRPVVPVHDVCPVPGSTSPVVDESSETAGLPAAAPDGSLYLVVGCGGRTYLSRSVDQAATWAIQHELPYPGELRIDTAGNMYLMRALTSPHRLLLSVSDDEGRSWSPEMDVKAPGVTFFENERTGIYGGRSCCTNWFYKVREPGHVAVAYSGRTDAQESEVDGYLTQTRNALAILDGGQPIFWSTTVNEAGKPLKFFAGGHRGANGSRGPQPGQASGLGGSQTNQVGVAIAPDGSAWASFTEDCGPSPDAPRCEEQNWQTRGYAGRLAWPD